MSSSLITDEIRAKASEMYKGHELCQEKSRFLLTEMGLPNGLLPLKDIIEVGYIKDTGFVWLIQKKKCEHRFEKIGKPVQYGAEVTAYVEQNRIKKLTGVKAKELLMWLTLTEISVDQPANGKITFKTPTGLSRSFPVDAFVLDEVEVEKKPAPIPAPAPASKAEVVAEAEAKAEKEVEVKVNSTAPAPGAVNVQVKEV